MREGKKKRVNISTKSHLTRDREHITLYRRFGRSAAVDAAAAITTDAVDAWLFASPPLHHIHVYVCECVYIIRQWKGNCEREKKKKTTDVKKYVMLVALCTTIFNIYFAGSSVRYSVCYWLFYSYHSIFHYFYFLISISLSRFVYHLTHIIFTVSLDFRCFAAPERKSKRQKRRVREKKTYETHWWTMNREKRSFVFFFFVMFCLVNQWRWISLCFSTEENFSKKKQHTHAVENNRQKKNKRIK